MSRFSHFGSGQRLGFALLCIGFCVCLTGCISPYWHVAELNISDFGEDIPFSGLLNDLAVMEINIGIWWYCVDFDGFRTVCENMYAYDSTGDLKITDRNHNGGSAWLNVARVMVIFNVALSLTCGLVAFCRGACCSGGRTIWHGVCAFLAGASGFAAVGIMASRKDSLLLLPLVHASYGWAFGIYIAGCCVLIGSSIFLCFGVPRESNGQVLYPSGPVPFVTVAQSSVHQYELNGQIQAFEPLPNPYIVQHQA